MVTSGSGRRPLQIRLVGEVMQLIGNDAVWPIRKKSLPMNHIATLPAPPAPIAPSCPSPPHRLAQVAAAFSPV